MAGQLTGLHAKFTGDSTSLQRATTQSAMALRKAEAAARKAKERSDELAASSEGLARQLHKLRMETDNDYAGMDRYRRAAELMNKVAQGQKWSTEQLSSELQKLAVHYGVAEQAGFNMNDQVRAGRFHTANLAAQFNDIGVMLASGQSPFILAVQQGTQITQVLQDMGGGVKSTFKALGGAFMSLISPTSLLTIGLIAGGAALYQWAVSADDAAAKTKTLDDVISDLADTQNKLKSAQDILEMSLDQLIEKYGKYALEARDAAMAIREFRIAEGESKLANQLTDATDELSRYAATMDAATASAEYASAEQAAFEGIMLDGAVAVSYAATQTEQALDNIMKDLKLTREQAIPLADAFRAVQEAASLQDKVAAFKMLQEAMATAGISSSQLPLSIKLALGSANELGLSMMELAALQDKIAAKSVEPLGADRERKNLFHALAGEMAAVSTYMGSAADNSQRLSANAGDALTKAREQAQQTLLDLQNQIELQRLINFYGQDSVEVARERAAQEREAFVATTMASKATTEMKIQLIKAYDAAAKLASVEYETPLNRAKIMAGEFGSVLGITLEDAEAAMDSLVASAPGAGWLSGAIGDAAKLGRTLWDAAKAAAAARGGSVVNADATKGPGFEGSGRNGSTLPPLIKTGPTFTELLAGMNGGEAGGGGGGGANPIDAELEALQKELMTKEQLEMESYERRQELLKEALDQKLLTMEEYNRLMEHVERTHQFAMGKETREGVSATLTALGSLFQGSKKIGAAIAVANSWLAFTEVLKDPAYVGRPWARFAAAASALASGLNAVRNIKSANPGSSGGTGGGAGGGGGAATSSGGQQVSQQVALQLVGGDLFSRDQVLKLINEINKATSDGARIVLR